jgi:outer membrane scaffolding protein for murein synthesis (MipA/OmpV family)
LRGLGDVGARAEGGAFFNVLSSDGYFFSSSVRYGSGQDSKGLLLDLGAGHATSLAPQWHLGVGAAVTVANAAYLQSYFGVTAAQAASSGYAVYTPGAGLRDARANLSLTHVLNPRTRITGALTVSSLLGDAKSSPLTRQKTTAAGLLAVAYAF